MDFLCKIVNVTTPSLKPLWLLRQTVGYSSFLLFVYYKSFPLLLFQLLQSALKGMQYFLNGGKWKAVPNQDLGTLLAVLKVCIV